eukprot:TRINITY_DN3768_c0_g1_i4.p1 TRINITY_DN3768_c0_g1~~TRINITY_DN3768_c0_g1_i4.p1  ORF type:complete len:357 (+),score=0.41 TRINITY_DN3768_c0_g1_i4:46-1116(+)
MSCLATFFSCTPYLTVCRAQWQQARTNKRTSNELYVYQLDQEVAQVWADCCENRVRKEQMVFHQVTQLQIGPLRTQGHKLQKPTVSQKCLELDRFYGSQEEKIQMQLEHFQRQLILQYWAGELVVDRTKERMRQSLVISSVILVLLIISSLLPMFSDSPPIAGLPFRSLWGAYLYQLQERPMLTKCVTSFIGFSLGDVTAQLLSSTPKYDFMRTARMAVYGGVIMGPLAHHWFNLLDKVVLPHHPYSPAAIVTKAALDQLIQAPIGLTLFYAYQETMQGRPHMAGKTIRQKLFPTLLMTWKFWPLAHLINFSVIPLEQRILYVNVVSVIYTCLLSRLASEKPSQSKLSKQTGKNSA